LRNPSQRLQGFDHRPDLWWRLTDRFVNRLLQLHNTFGSVIHFLHVIGERGLQRRLLEADVALNPLPVLFGPSLDSFRPASMSQEKLPQPVARFQLILLGRFASANQVAERLVIGIRHPDSRQFTGAVAPRRLHSVPGFGWHQARRDYLTGNSQTG
jgi:hypothetical protein